MTLLYGGTGTVDVQQAPNGARFVQLPWPRTSS
jgi:hypothetical protein